jgi:3D (Asp-Asp-Asp) domain-containing protein/HKD family nuclease
MKTKEECSETVKTRTSVIKIVCVSILLLFLSGVGVMAVTTQIGNVKITLANGYEMNVLTSKTTVSEILEENNIILTEDEKVTPNLDEEITESKTIEITNKSKQEVKVAKISEDGVEVSLEQLLESYSPVTEKIVVEQEAIPFETVTRDASSGATDTKNKVLQEGQDGIKEVTYKIKYQNNEEIERTVLDEVVVQEPVDKIVQVQKNITSRATTTSRSSTVTTPTTGETSSLGVYKITGYCSCSICCGKSASGYTSSGTKATSGRTIAASSQFSFGTQLSINGNTYTVEDRGGAIKGNKIDIYFDSHAQALAWGVRYLPVELVQ